MKKTTIILLLFIQNTVFSEILDIGVSKNNTLFESSTGSLSNGSGLYTFVGKTGVNEGQKLRRTITKFDVTAIPPDATINSVIIRFTVSEVPNGAQPATANLHLVLTDWGEGGSDSGDPGGDGAPSQVNDATWAHAFFPSQNWSNLGGDFNPASSATANYGSSNGEIIIFSGSSDLVADVQLWVETPINNFGWVIIGDETTAGNTRRLQSRHSSIASGAPTIIIDYTMSDNIFANGFD